MDHSQGFFANLLLFEQVLLILGVVLFLVLIGRFIYLLIKNRLRPWYGALLLIPVVMIGFPSIKTMDFMNGLIKFENKTAQLEQDPNNHEVKEQIEESIEKWENKPVRSTRQQNALIEAYIALGNLDQAGQDIKLLQKEGKGDKRTEINEERIKILKQAEKIKLESDDFRMTNDLKKSIEKIKNYPQASAMDRAAIGTIENATMNR